MAKRIVLLDGDTVLFAATSAAQHETNWDEGEVWYLWTNLDDAKERFVSSLERIRRDLNADHVVVGLSCDKDKRFRRQIMPTYKAHRDGKRKPVGYFQLRDWVQEEYDTYMREGLEGDDVLGILATHPKLYKGEKIIAAVDKDLKTVPGKLYNYDTKDFSRIMEYEADRFFIKQTLMGDRTDGYPGCPGVGPVTAERILNEAEERMKAGPDPDFRASDYWPWVLEAYEKKGLSENVALMNARVARILRATDYDYKNKEPILWTP